MFRDPIFVYNVDFFAGTVAEESGLCNGALMTMIFHPLDSREHWPPTRLLTNN